MRARLTEAFPDRPVYAVSAITGAGLKDLIDALTLAVAEIRRRLREDDDFAQAQAALEEQINTDVLASALEVRRQRGTTEASASNSTHSEEADDDGDVEVIYVDE